jgi:hypothetical protein
VQAEPHVKRMLKFPNLKEYIRGPNNSSKNSSVPNFMISRTIKIEIELNGP